MPTYVMTFNYTDQGIRNVKDSPARIQGAKQTVRSMGGEVKAFYGILGAEYDTLFILEAPDDEAVAKMALGIASQGNVRTSTHRALSEGDFGRVVSGIG